MHIVLPDVADVELQKGIDKAKQLCWLTTTNTNHIRIAPAGSDELACDECKAFFAKQREDDFIEYFQNTDRSKTEQDEIDATAHALFSLANKTQYHEPLAMSEVVLRFLKLRSQALRNPKVDKSESEYFISLLISRAHGLPALTGNPIAFSSAALSCSEQRRWIKIEDNRVEITAVGHAWLAEHPLTPATPTLPTHIQFVVNEASDALARWAQPNKKAVEGAQAFYLSKGIQKNGGVKTAGLDAFVDGFTDTPENIRLTPKASLNTLVAVIREISDVVARCLVAQVPQYHLVHPERPSPIAETERISR